MKTTASLYLAADIAKECDAIPVEQIAILLVSLASELWKCPNVEGFVDAADWCRSITSKPSRRRKAVNEIGRKWRGRLSHYDKLETAILGRCAIVTDDEMRGLFSEIKF